MTGGRSNAGLRKRHALQLFKTDMCKFFLQGRCENGDRCSYAHTSGEVRHKPDLTRTSLCKNIAQSGTCEDPTCRFAHSENQLCATHGFFKMKMCSFAQSGRCRHGATCRFAHSPDELRPAKPPVKSVDDDLLLSQARAQATSQQLVKQVLCMAQQAQQSQSGTQTISVNDVIFGLPEQEAAQNKPVQGRVGDGSIPGLGGDSRSEAPSASGQAGAQRMPHSRNFRNINAQSKSSDRMGTTRLSVASWNDSRSITSSGSGNSSSITEVPWSEHTGSPITMSESSSGEGNGSGGGSGGCEYAADSGTAYSGSTTASAGITTLLITSIPQYLTQGALLSMFEDLTDQMRGQYDFFYCPWDETDKHNLSCALIDFMTPEGALAFQKRWMNKELCHGVRGQKPLRVTKAALQGLQENLEYFSKVAVTPCTEPRFRPLFRNEQGVLLPLLLNNPETTPPADDQESPSPQHGMPEYQAPEDLPLPQRFKSHGSGLIRDVAKHGYTNGTDGANGHAQGRGPGHGNLHEQGHGHGRRYGAGQGHWQSQRQHHGQGYGQGRAQSQAQGQVQGQLQGQVQGQVQGHGGGNIGGNGCDDQNIYARVGTSTGFAASNTMSNM